MAYLDVTDATFQTEVVARSATVPVVIDLWAPWCGPCRTLGPIIERVIDATGGKVVLTKVNVDDNPRIGEAFQVQSIPAVFAVVDGKIADSFIGALPEHQVAAWVAGLVPVRSEAEILTEEGIDGRDQAKLRKALELEPANAKAIIGLAELLVEAKQPDEALQLLSRIPETPETIRVAAMARLSAGPDGANDTAANDDTAHDHTVTELENLLPLVKSDEQAKQRFLDLLAVMGDDPRVAGLRRRLAAQLF